MSRHKISVLISILIIFFSLYLAGCVQKFAKLEEKRVPEEYRKKAEVLARLILSSNRDGIFKPFGDFADQNMRDTYTPEVQRQTYESLKILYGDYMDLTYQETWVPELAMTIYVCRFRGRFSSSDEEPEIRIALDNDMKMIGFWVRPWKNEMK